MVNAGITASHLSVMLLVVSDCVPAPVLRQRMARWLGASGDPCPAGSRAHRCWWLP